MTDIDRYNNIEYTDYDEINTVSQADEEISEDTALKSENKLIQILSHIKMWYILVFVFVVFVISVIFFIKNWGTKINMADIEKTDYETAGYQDLLDQFFPVTDASGHIVEQKLDKILLFGNAPFADDKESKDSLANMIAKRTGATVINCSIPNSRVTCLYPAFTVDTDPYDGLTPYYLYLLACYKSTYDYYMLENPDYNGTFSPETIDIIHELMDINLDDIDVICYMYDASDYIMGNPVVDYDNPQDVTTYVGNLNATFSLIHSTHPEIRTICMSPTYAFAVDEEGNYVSSEKYRYSEYGTLSTYVILTGDICAASSISYVDNLFSDINEDSADKYLTDNLHLNEEGRKKVLERFMYALEYYD